LDYVYDQTKEYKEKNPSYKKIEKGKYKEFEK